MRKEDNSKHISFLEICTQIYAKIYTPLQSHYSLPVITVSPLDRTIRSAKKEKFHQQNLLERLRSNKERNNVPLKTFVIFRKFSFLKINGSIFLQKNTIILLGKVSMCIRERSNNGKKAGIFNLSNNLLRTENRQQ
jgi:hypothetical protein